MPLETGVGDCRAYAVTKLLRFSSPEFRQIELDLLLCIIVWAIRTI